MNSLYEVLLVVRPQGWIPAEWDDLPPAPFEVFATEGVSDTLAGADGFRFGFNTESMDCGGSLWAVVSVARGAADGAAP